MKVWWIVSGLVHRADGHIERGVAEEVDVRSECSLAPACGGRPGQVALPWLTWCQWVIMPQQSSAAGGGRHWRRELDAERVVRNAGRWERRAMCRRLGSDQACGSSRAPQW